MGNAAKALSTWYTQLTGNQATTDLLEAEAKKLKKMLGDAQDAVHSASAAVDRAHGDAKHAALQSLGRASLHAEAIQNALDAVINWAKKLQKTHLQQANAAAEGVKAGEDDSFQPENDNWVVQVLDGVSKTTDVVSTVSATVAAASLVVPGAGEVVAPVAGAVAAGAAGIHTVAALGQKAVGSKNAGSWVDIGIGAVPTKAITKPAGLAVKKLVRTGEKEALSKAFKDGIADAHFAKVVKSIKTNPTSAAGREAVTKGLKEDGEKLGKIVNKLPGEDVVTAKDYEALGRWRKAHEAAAGAVDSTDKVHQVLDPDYTQSDGTKRGLNVLKTTLDPSTDRATDWLIKGELGDLGKRTLGEK
jgi:hypothetical protein